MKMDEDWRRVMKIDALLLGWILHRSWSSRWFLLCGATSHASSSTSSPLWDHYVVWLRPLWALHASVLVSRGFSKFCVSQVACALQLTSVAFWLKKFRLNRDGEVTHLPSVRILPSFSLRQWGASRTGFSVDGEVTRLTMTQVLVCPLCGDCSDGMLKFEVLYWSAFSHRAQWLDGHGAESYNWTKTRWTSNS